VSEPRPEAESETRAYRVAEGEQAVVRAGPPEEGEIRSRGFLPFRVRTEGVPYRRPAFCGTAIVLGERTYEVIRETETEAGVVYSLRSWPEGEVVRDRVIYGPRVVRAAQEDRERAAMRERVRPYRFLLYPLVGLLPEEEQERVALRFGLYTVKATFASGMVEALLPFLAIWLIAKSADEGLRVVVALLTPAIWLICLSGFSRAFAAAAFRETSGSYLVEVAFAAMKALGHAARRDPTLVPLSRQAFWTRLEVPDRIEPDADGSLVCRGLLPHLTWHTGHHVRAHHDYWLVEALPPALLRGRLVYSYRLYAVDAEPARPRMPPEADAYAAEVWAGVRREWDDLLVGFAWLASLLSPAAQQRAFADRGGPAAARRSVLVTSLAGSAFAIFVLAQPIQAGDPVGPWLRLLSVLLLIDGAIRIARTLRGDYAPSLFRWALPSDCLRPERIAYHAHREAERAAWAAVRDAPP
jgi:hypothetical protein